MPINFKSKLSSVVANATFLDKTIDDEKKGRLGLFKNLPTDPDAINDVQDYLNEIADTIGQFGEGDPERKNWTSEFYISDGQNYKEAIETLDTASNTIQTNLTNHIDQSTGAHEASAVSYDGTTSGLAATDAQAAIDENNALIDDNAADIQAIIDSVDSPDGICPLDSSSKVPIANLPDAVLGALKYQGTWNATTNTPTIVSGTGTQGHYYVVSTAGTTNIDGEADWEIGDWIVFNGTAWEKIDNSDKVSSVNGYTGVVTLVKSDIGLGNVTDDAQLKREAGDINSFTEKLLPVEGDFVLIEDSEDSFEKKKVDLANLIGGGGSGGGGSFQWEAGDIAPIDSWFKGMTLMDFDFESNMEIFALVTVPESYEAGTQVFLKNAKFFADAGSGNVLFRCVTAVLRNGVDVTGTLDEHTSVNTELTLTTNNAITSIGDIDLTDSVGEINSNAVQPLDVLVIKLYRDNTNETSPANADARFLKYSATVDFEG